MALWNKLQTELDRFGRAAQSAFDEGKARLEILRVRQLADRAAQALGYAVYNARKEGGELDAETYARLSSTLAAHEAEATRLEAQMEAARTARAETMSESGESGDAGATSAGGTSGDAGAAGTAGAASGSSEGAPSSVDPAMGDTGTGTGPSTPTGGGGAWSPGGSAGGGATGGSTAGGTGGGSTGSGATGGAGGTPPYSGPQGSGSSGGGAPPSGAW